MWGRETESEIRERKRLWMSGCLGIFEFVSGGDEHNVCSGRLVTPLALSPCDAFQCFALCGGSLLHCTVPQPCMCCVLRTHVPILCVCRSREPCPESRVVGWHCAGASARPAPEISRFQSPDRHAPTTKQNTLTSGSTGTYVPLQSHPDVSRRTELGLSDG